MLKCLFVVQQRRVEKILVLEERTGLLLPEGHKNVAVLKNIAAEARKLELGQLAVKGMIPRDDPVAASLVSGGELPAPIRAPISLRAGQVRRQSLAQSRK